VRKLTLSLPHHIDCVLTCPNGNCISRSEPVPSSFSVKSRADAVHLQCRYCEKEFEHQVVLQAG